MRLNDDVVVLERNGCKKIIVVDPLIELGDGLFYGRSLEGASYIFKSQMIKDENDIIHLIYTHEGVCLPPLYMYEDVMSNFRLSQNCKIDNDLLLVIEDAINVEELENSKNNKR